MLAYVLANPADAVAMADHILRYALLQHVHASRLRRPSNAQDVGHLLHGDVVQLLVRWLDAQALREPGAAHHNRQHGVAALWKAAAVVDHTEYGQILRRRHQEPEAGPLHQIVAVVLQIDERDVHVRDGGQFGGQLGVLRGDERSEPMAGQAADNVVELASAGVGVGGDRDGGLDKLFAIKC